MRNTLLCWLTQNLLPKIAACVLTAPVSYFYCQSIFNKHSTRLIFITPLYFPSHFFKFWRIILSSVSNICDMKFFFSSCFWFIHISPPYYITLTSFFSHAAVNRANVFILYIHTKKLNFFWWLKIFINFWMFLKFLF